MNKPQPQNPIVWTPSEHDLKKSSLARFRDIVNKKYGLQLRTYHDLHAWSVDPSTAGDFWMELFDFLDMGASKPPTRAFYQVSALDPTADTNLCIFYRLAETCIPVRDSSPEHG